MKTIRSALQEIQAIEIYHNIPITALAVDNNASKNQTIVQLCSSQVDKGKSYN